MMKWGKICQLFLVLGLVGFLFQLQNGESGRAMEWAVENETYQVHLPLVATGGISNPGLGDVVINEFLAANGTLYLTEWVELYNRSTKTLDLSGMWIDDIAAGGGVPKQIPANTFLPAKGFYVMTFSSFLNNTGDEVRLLAADGNTVFDAKTYASASVDKSWCRQPDGENWAISECEPSFGNSNSPLWPRTRWTPGNLEIHVLNVGQGDAQLIIGPSGKTLLIDVAELSWNSSQGALLVANEIQYIMGSTHLDYILASHWHLDHIGYAGIGGIWSLLEEQGISADVLIDRDGGVWNDLDQDGICDAATEIEWHNAGTISGTAERWVCWATDPTSPAGQIRELAQLGSSSQIDLGIDQGVVVTIVQVDADGVMMLGGSVPVAGDHTREALPPSENDYSITIWLQWEKFDYVTGGDTDGEYATSSYGYVYNDVESEVAARLSQDVEVLRVNHHGSSHSSNAFYVNTLSPAVAVYSVGSSNSYGHPDQSVLDRLSAQGTRQYFTQYGDSTRDYGDSIIMNGNVVISVQQGLTYTVAGDTYQATDPTGSAPRKPLIGEIWINEFLPAPQSLFLTEWIELYNATPDRLDIGGMWIDDLITGGQAPQQIPVGTTLSPFSYYVQEITSYLNNAGDDVNLLGTDGVTLFDSYSYPSTSYDLSYCRFPDGGPWYPNCQATKGATNVR